MAEKPFGVLGLVFRNAPRTQGPLTVPEWAVWGKGTASVTTHLAEGGRVGAARGAGFSDVLP